MHYTCILLYVISDLLLKVEYFVESAGVRYLRTGCRLKQRCLQKLKKRVCKCRTKHFPLALCLLYTYWDIQHFSSRLYQIYTPRNDKENEEME